VGWGGLKRGFGGVSPYRAPQHSIAAFTDLSGSVDLTRLIDAWCQAEMRADPLRSAEAAEIIDRGLER
jgi:hypothetical protein